MLKRIHIKGYKSLVDVEVQLQPLSVLFGPNAAGKSNFLDALQLVSRIPTSRTLKEAFEPPYRGKPLESFTFGPGGLNDLIQQDVASFSVEVDVELAPNVISDVDRQIREMRKGKATDSDKGNKSKTPASVREKNLRYRIEVEILPGGGEADGRKTQGVGAVLIHDIDGIRRIAERFGELSPLSIANDGV